SLGREMASVKSPSPAGAAPGGAGGAALTASVLSCAAVPPPIWREARRARNPRLLNTTAQARRFMLMARLPRFKESRARENVGAVPDFRISTCQVTRRIPL